MNRGIRHAAGFTLLEILLALVLMSLVMLGVWGALSGAARIGHATDAVMAASENVRTAQQFLRRYLASADPQPFVTGAGAPARMFQGDATSMRYVAPLPIQSGHAGLYVQTLSLEKDRSGGLALWLAYAPYTGFHPASARPVRHLLLANLRRGSFQYLVQAAVGSAPAWRGGWQSVSGLPLAVRIHIEPGWRARVAFPEMLVRLHSGDGLGGLPGGAP